MPFIFDNLTATLISMTVVLILASIQMNATQVNTARTSRNAVNTKAQQMATWLEEDLRRIGRNMPASTTPYDSPVDSTEWHTTEFAFEYVDSSGTHVDVRYDLETTGQTAMIDGDEKDLLALQRMPDGRSPPRLGYFTLDLLDENGAQAGTPDSIAFVRARFSVIAPFQNEQTLPRRVHRIVAVPYRPGQQ